MDYYEKGLYDTMGFFDSEGIMYTGVGRNIDEARKPAVMEKRGVKIALLSYTEMADITFAGQPYLKFSADTEKSGVAPLNPEYIKKDISDIREKVDLVMVSLHWGIEESFEIAPGQRELAYEILDCGADIILGHHTHQFQGIEIYKNKPIIYSMGNFIFDQNDPENQESFILDISFEGSVLKELSAIPVRTVEKTQVVPQTGLEASAILKRQIELCEKLDTPCRADGDRLIFDLK